MNTSFDSLHVQLKEELAELDAKIQGIPDQHRGPKTAFELLEAKGEADWQAYLSYFLDPDSSHGINERFLREMLIQLADLGAITFAPSQTALRAAEEINVQQERQSPDANRPDIVVSQAEEWFLCLELKLYSRT